MPAPRNDLDTDKIIQLYQTGSSTRNIGRIMGASDDAIRRILRRAHVDLRDKSQAGVIRANREGELAKARRRGQLVANRGDLVTDEAMRNRAIHNESTQRLVGKFEAQVYEWLRFGGFKTRRQVALERYNLDLLVMPNLAVEVHTVKHRPQQGPHFTGFSRRIETLFNAGVGALYLWCPDGINPGDGYKLISQVERLSGKPPAHGEYWVLRCHGYPAATGRPKYPRLPLVPSASYPPNPSGDDRCVW